MKYMIDTCIFNYILDGIYSLTDLPKGEYFITHIQKDELQKTPDEARRNELMTQLNVINPEKETTSVFILGRSRLEEAQLGQGKYYQIILAMLNKRKKKKSNCNDAIIGDTCIKLRYKLITGDFNFKEIMEEIWDKSQVIYWKK